MTDNENLEECLIKTLMEVDSIGHYDKCDPIFHYTSPDGLLGILQEKGPTLWFSQYDSLNDTTEGTHAIDVYQRACKELLENGTIDRHFYQAICKVKPMTKEMFLYDSKSLQGDETSVDEITITDYFRFEEGQKYVCCFSKNRDSLPMWNYYTKGDKYEGYNIGFCFWRTRQSDVQNCFGKGYSIDFFTVIYDDEIKKKIIRDKLAEIYSFYKRVAEDSTLQRIQSDLSYYLGALNLKFKQDCFKHEKEVRAVLTIPKNSTQFPVEYRSKAGYIIPFIRLHFPKEVVSGITVGPLLNDKVAEKNIRQFAEAHGYLIDGNDIQLSKIPIRY